MSDDNEFLRTLRSRVLYAGYKNSLVEWMVSPDWVQAPRVLDSRGNRLARGSKVGMTGITFNEVSGEIACR